MTAAGCNRRWDGFVGASPEPCGRHERDEAFSTEAVADAKSGAEDASPRDKLEGLKRTLSFKIRQMQERDESLQELECNLTKAKMDLAHIKEKYLGRDQAKRCFELARSESKLSEFRETLLGAVFHLEKALKNMSNCSACSRCSCKNFLYEDGETIMTVKKNLEAMQAAKISVDEFSVSAESFKGSVGCSNDSSLQCGQVKVVAVDYREVDNFRVKAIAGLTALEEMKEQIDILHELIKKHYQEMPSDYEKSQIEDCESKLEKLRAQFDEITDGLCSMVEAITCGASEKKNENAGDDSTIECKSNEEEEIASEKVSQLLAEQKRLQAEICSQQQNLTKVKKDLKEVEKELSKRKCQSAEQEKEIKSRDREISKLREGVKGFRKRLKEMQIEIAENLDDKCKLDAAKDSCSNLSILSEELQELCDILTSSQTSFPGIIEKCKEENNQMRDKLHCLEKCLRNKDETLTLLQQSLKLRDGQVEDLNCRLQGMETELERLRREVEEKNRLICNLQDSMRKAKEFELRIKDESIEALQFQVCELNYRLKAAAKKVADKTKELEVLQDEILIVSSKNFFLNREIDVMEPKLGKLQKNLVLYEKMVCHLQKELNSRECEVESLYEKVKSLEKELECELKKCEQRTLEDSECINELSTTIRKLRNELQILKANCGKCPCETRCPSGRNDDDQSEDPCKKPDLSNVICQLRNEVKFLRKQLKECEKRDEMSEKVADLENVIKQERCRQQKYNEKINQLQKTLEETKSVHECEKTEIIQRLCKEENENVKNKLMIAKLNDVVKLKTTVENNLKETISRFTCDVESLKNENESLKMKMEAADRKLKEEPEKREMDRLINDLKAQKSDLKTRCCSLRSELDKEETLKKSLEERIRELNEMLSVKTNQAQETLSKLKDAEGRLKCMKMEMSKSRVNLDDVDEEDEDCMDDDKEKDKRCLEDSLVAKTAEYSDLMSEVQCLQVKLKTMQGEYISSQANKDCEMARLNREINRLESQLDLAEKENGKLRCDFKRVQDELNNRSRMEDSIKEDCDQKDRELCSALCEKNKLLKSIDELQKRLEELCLDNTKTERENKDLRDECARLKKELENLECELSEVRYEFETLKSQYNDSLEKFKCSEKKRMNMERLYCRMNEENSGLLESKNAVERELCQMRTENVMIKEKMNCLKKQRDREAKKQLSENSNIAQEKVKYCSRIKELTCRLKNYEDKVIPELEDEIVRKDRCIEGFKGELQEANLSSQKMRDESLKVIQHTKKYLLAQRCANEANKIRAQCSSDNKNSMSNEYRDLDDQLKSVTRMNETLYFDLQNGKNECHDTEPRSYSPLPWGYSSVERDNSSPEYLTESGFQSMQQSPTNMNYMNDYCTEMKRTPSQWNHSNSGRRSDGSDYSPCRNNSVR